MLEVRDLHAYYGKSHILHGVHLSVGDGEIVSLLGRNGVRLWILSNGLPQTFQPIGTC